MSRRTYSNIVDLIDVAAGEDGFKFAAAPHSGNPGHSVSNAGDVNGDGQPDLFVGTPFGTGSPGTQGLAYVVFGEKGMTDVDLSDVASGIGGFKIEGEIAGSGSGFEISSAGDVNRDGRADLLIGSSGNDSGGENAGAAYVVFGKSGTSAVSLGDVAAGVGGFKIQGEKNGDAAGGAVSAAGDLNRDGFSDVLVGAVVNNDGGYYAGAAYLVFGKADGSLVNLKDVAEGTGGFKVQGESAHSQAGYSVSEAGDFNRDGIDDVVIGTANGAAYVVFGKADGTLVDLDDVAAGIGGLKITGGASGDGAGQSVSLAGDVNRDGHVDLLIGAPNDDSGGSLSGAAYVVFGTTGTAPIDLGEVAAGFGGFKIQGEAAVDAAGGSVSAAGDVNRDGYDDVIIGAHFNDSGGDNAGAAYVVFGKADGALVNLADVALRQGGVKIQGEAAADLAGAAVSAAGDVNNDGYDDVLVGSLNTRAGSDGRVTGGAYVVFGDKFDPVPTRPEISVVGKSHSIADGDTTPSLTDATDFGTLPVDGEALVQRFVIENEGDAPLELTGVRINGPSASDFTVTQQPDTLIEPGQSGAFNVRFDPSAAGLRSATLSISNNDSDENPYDFAIQGKGLGSPPTAVDDTFTVVVAELGESGARLDVVNNDVQGDGRLDRNSITITDQPDHGDVMVSEGVIYYQPDANFGGPDAFAYTVGDQHGATSGPAKVRLNVVPPQPLAAVDDTFTVAVAGLGKKGARLDILVNDTVGDAMLDPNSVAITDQPDHGDVTVKKGVVYYQPDANYGGTDTFAYTVGDKGGATSDPATVRLEVVPPEPPTAVDDTFTVAIAGLGKTGARLDVARNDVQGDAKLDRNSVAITDQPDHGDVTVKKGMVYYQPDANYGGPDAFAYTVGDKGGATSDPATVRLEVVPPQPPTAVDDTFAVEVAGLGKKGARLDVLVNDTVGDAKLDRNSVAITDQPDHGDVTVKKGVVYYQPDANFGGTDAFAYTVGDQHGATSDTATVQLEVVPPEPPMAVDDTFTVAVAELGKKGARLDVLVNDTVGDAKLDRNSVAITDQPDHGDVTVKKGVVYYQPDAGFEGADSLAYLVSDRSGTVSNKAAVSISVDAVLSRANDIDPESTLAAHRPNEGSASLALDQFDTAPSSPAASPISLDDLVVDVA